MLAVSSRELRRHGRPRRRAGRGGASARRGGADRRRRRPTLGPVGEIEEDAEQGTAIVVHQFDEAGFVDEAAEFDEMAGMTYLQAALRGIPATVRRSNSLSLEVFDQAVTLGPPAVLSDVPCGDRRL